MEGAEKLYEGQAAVGSQNWRERKGSQALQKTLRSSCLGNKICVVMFGFTSGTTGL